MTGRREEVEREQASNGGRERRGYIHIRGFRPGVARALVAPYSPSLYLLLDNRPLAIITPS
jgi:hypothetical protein